MGKRKYFTDGLNKKAIINIFYFYNNVRIKTGLNNMSSVEFRKQTFAV